MPDNQKNTAEEDVKDLEAYYNKNKTNGQGSFDTLDVHQKEQLLKNYQSNEGKTPYLISYGDVITNTGDETYTHIDGRVGKDNYKVYGLNENTKMINIGNRVSTLKSDVANKTFDILVNHYISSKLNVGTGDTFDIVVSNSIHRLEKTYTKPET